MARVLQAVLQADLQAVPQAFLQAPQAQRTFCPGLSSSSRLQKCAHVPRFFSLKKIVIALRSDSAVCTGCRLQCVK
jgi:hypothetical protein